MMFDWLEYLTLAQELTSTSMTSSIQEAHLRCAISRAYYAAFCKARNHLIYIEHNPPPYNVNVHIYVGSTFESSSDTTRHAVGALLHHLRSTRNVADYKDKFKGNLLGITRGALSEAEEIIRLLGTLIEQQNLGFDNDEH